MGSEIETTILSDSSPMSKTLNNWTTVSRAALVFIPYICLMRIPCFLHTGVRIQLRLKDPSCGQYFAVSCFDARYFGWLPQVIKGDVLVLHNVKVSSNVLCSDCVRGITQPISAGEPIL